MLALCERNSFEKCPLYSASTAQLSFNLTTAPNVHINELRTQEKYSEQNSPDVPILYIPPVFFLIGWQFQQCYLIPIYYTIFCFTANYEHYGI